MAVHWTRGDLRAGAPRQRAAPDDTSTVTVSRNPVEHAAVHEHGTRLGDALVDGDIVGTLGQGASADLAGKILDAIQQIPEDDELCVSRSRYDEVADATVRASGKAAGMDAARLLCRGGGVVGSHPVDRRVVCREP